MEVSSSQLFEPTFESSIRQSKATWAVGIVKERIKCGRYKAGEQLPSLRTLSAELNLTVPVMQRAVRQLEREGLLESQHGIGIRILDNGEFRAAPLLFGFVQPYFSLFSQAVQHYIESVLDSQFNLCILKSSHDDAERERLEIERLIKRGINGLLVWPVAGDTNGPFFREIAERLPMVFVDRTLPEVRTLSVVLDYGKAARQIVRALYKQGKRNLLVVCDPAKISSFEQLKEGLRHEADLLGASDMLTFLDHEVVKLIESAYKEDYGPADECYDLLAPMLRSGDYDSIFCPQSELFLYTFPDQEKAAAMQGIKAVTMRSLDGLPHSRTYYQMGIEEWMIDNPKMMVSALELLQDMTLSRTPRHRTIKLPICRRDAPPKH